MDRGPIVGVPDSDGKAQARTPGSFSTKPTSCTTRCQRRLIVFGGDLDTRCAHGLLDPDRRGRVARRRIPRLDIHGSGSSSNSMACGARRVGRRGTGLVELSAASLGLTGIAPSSRARPPVERRTRSSTTRRTTEPSPPEPPASGSPRRRTDMSLPSPARGSRRTGTRRSSKRFHRPGDDLDSHIGESFAEWRRRASSTRTSRTSSITRSRAGAATPTFVPTNRRCASRWRSSC